MTPPRRFKTDEELTTAEHLDRISSGRMPETDEYRAYRRQTLEAAGLEDDDAPGKTGEPMSVADDLKHITRTR